MKLLQIVSLILFAAFSGVHLYHSFLEDQEKRKRTKPFLLLFLIAFYAFSAGSSYNLFLLLALVTSWLGDVLLIPKGHHWFALGGTAFGAAHIFFILVYSRNIVFSGISWPLIVIVALLYFGIAFQIIRATAADTPKIMVGPMYLYLLANATMNVFALMQLWTNHNLATAIAYIGALLFFVSDCTLFLVRYYKKNENLIFHKHFTVMLTYLLGEFLIVLGVLLQG